MIIEVKDNNFLKIEEANDGELKQMQVSLTKKIKNAWFNPLVKKGIWDGRVSFIDKSHRIPVGLWYYVQEICEQYNFEFNIKGLDKIIDENFDKEDFIEWQSEFFKNHDKKPRDYQIDAACKILKWCRCCAELATSSGKTLVNFMMWAYLKQRRDIKKFLIVVPNISLVTQGIDDFEEYSLDRGAIKYKIQAIGGGNDKKRKDVDIIIGTFQTLTKLDNAFFEDVDVISVDEAHYAPVKSIKSILSKCKNARYRFGVSGTMRVDDFYSCESLTTISLLGPLVDKISAKFLIDNNYATPVYIRMIYMDYLDEATKEALYKLKTKKKNKDGYDGTKMLALEREIIVDNEKRFNFIVKAISKVDKNSMVLFYNIKDSYGKRIADRLKEVLDNTYDVFYVDGQTSDQERQRYINRMDETDKKVKILVASFGTFSTGISINNLHYIFLVESFKSDRLIKQSLGRGMRLLENKTIIKIVDFVDDFSYKGNTNYSLNHAEEREAIYRNEHFSLKKLTVKF